MNIVLIFKAIAAALAFPTELAALIRLLEKTPEEKRQEVSNRIQAELEAVLAGGRPKWD